MSTKNRSQEIVEAIQSGNNTKVLQHLYQTSLPQIMKFISINNGDEDEAKDIFQDAVVALFTTVKMGKFDAERDVNAFLFFVSRNLWINRVKKRSRQIDFSKTKLSAYEESPMAVVISEEKKMLIDQMLDLVGSKCKQILKLVLYDGMSMKEIAKIMQLSGEDVAKSTHYRCKQKLIELVGNNKAALSLFKE